MAHPSRVLPDSPASQRSSGLRIDSRAFRHGDRLPRTYTRDGPGISPPLNLWDVPAEAAELVLVLEDRDAASHAGRIHWLLYGLSPDTRYIPEGLVHDPEPQAIQGARQGVNGEGGIGYLSPAPPPDNGAHRYRFRLFACARPLELEPGADMKAVARALGDEVLAEARLTVTYER